MDRDSNELINVICAMVRHIQNADSLNRIYNVVSRLLKKEADG